MGADAEIVGLGWLGMAFGELVLVIWVFECALAVRMSAYLLWISNE